MPDASITMNAKNNVSAVLQQVGKDLKDTEKGADKMGGAMSAAGGAVKSALAGNFVEAAKQTSAAWKNFAAALASNPILAIGTAAVAAVGGLLQLAKALQQHAADVRKAREENDEFLASLDRIRNGTQTASEAIRSDADRYVEAGDTKSIERRLALLRQEADGLKEVAETAQARLMSLQSSMNVGAWEGLKGLVGAQTRDEAITDAREARDRFKTELEGVMDQIKVLEAAQQKIADNRAKAAADAAAAEEKAAADAAAAAEKAAEREAKAAQEAAEKKAKAEKDARDALEREHEDLTQKKARMEEEAAEKAKQAWIKSLKEAADKQVQDAEKAVAAATAAWNISGGNKADRQARREQRQAERQAEKDARQQQRALERWENGARDRRATAAHDLDEARKAMQAAKDQVTAANQAAADYQKEQDAKRLQLMSSMESRMRDIETELKQALYPA